MNLVYLILLYHFQKFRIGNFFRGHIPLPAAEHAHEKKRHKRDQQKQQNHLTVCILFIIGIMIPIIG